VADVSGGSVFRVTDPGAPRRVVDPAIGDITDKLAEDVRARTPVQTGRLQEGWTVERGPAEATRLLVNPVPYARYVEYGTKNMRAEPMLGAAIAEART
jgi:hypothetical protein